LAEQFAVELTLEPRKPPVVHGENGVSQKAAGEGHASHYVSFTRLDARGTIAVQGQNFAVKGSAWMDHEFFTNSLGAEEAGWDWLSMQFDDDTEVMLYRLRHKDGSVDPFSSGTYVDASGHASHLGLQDFTMRPTAGVNWTSSTSGATYPLAWEVTIPRYGIELQVRTPLQSQELNGRTEASPNYWEGAVEMSGKRGGHSLHGLGYLELTGYDRPLPLSGLGR
jgi:predicted secreted hydrolase